MTAVTSVLPSAATRDGVGDEPTGADVWAALVQSGIDLFRTHEFHRVSLELLAERSGRGLAEVRAHFPTFDDLVVAVVQVWNAERMAPIWPIAQQSGAVAFLRGIVQANIADPALMRFLTATVNLTAMGESPIAPLLEQLWLKFHAFVQRTLAHDIEVGREPATMEPARGAEQLIALYEGLQLQSMVRPAMHLLEAYDRAAHRLRDGWSHAYAPAVWEI